LRPDGRDAPGLPCPRRSTARRRGPRAGHRGRPRFAGRRASEHEGALMARAVELRLDAMRLAQDGRVLTATAVAPPLSFVTTELIRDLDRLTAAVDTADPW